MPQKKRSILRKKDFIVARSTTDQSVQKIVAPKHFQIGLDDPEFSNSSLKVYGRSVLNSGAIIRHGITGSLQVLASGRSYLRQGNNISIVSGSDGSITIGVDSSSFSGNTTNALTVGNGITLNSGTTFNGSAAKTISLNLETNSGLAFNSGKLTIDPSSLSEATPATGDFFLVEDATDNTIKKVDFSSLSISAQAGVTLNNKLTAGNGLTYGGSNNFYNNSSAETMSISFASNAGLAFNSSNKLVVSPAAASSKSSPHQNDIVLIADSEDSNNIKKVTLSSLTAANTLSNVLNIGNGLDTVSGATVYNNSATQTVRVKTNGPTISSDASGISVSSTPGTLSAGSGISSFSFNGSSNSSVTVDASTVATFSAGGTFSGNVIFGGNVYGKFNEVSAGVPLLIGGTNVTVSTAGNGQMTINASNTVDIAAQPSGTPTRADLLLIEQGGTNKKSTIAQVAALVDRTTLVLGGDTINISSPDADTASTISVKLSGDTLESASSGIRVKKVPSTIIDGYGIKDFSFDGASEATVEIDKSIVATLDGADFQGVVKFQSGLTGSLQALMDGSPYIVGGTGISVNTSSNGKITITNDFSSTPTDPGIFNVGLSGSLQVLADGTTPYLVGGGNIQITTGSNGQVTIFGAGGSGTGADPFAHYVVVGLTGSLANERVLTAGNGIKINDAGSNNSISLLADDSIVATLTGSVFSGNVVAQLGLSGSLQKLADGSSYLREGANVSIVSGSDGSVTISTTGGTIGAAEDESYTDGLFTDFTTTTPIGTPIDRFNEILKLLVPAPAPDLDDIDVNSDGADVKLSFGTSNDQSSATPAYANVAASAGIGAAVNVNGDYITVGTPGNSTNLRAAVYNGSTDLIGDLNEDATANITTPSNETNYVANSFGNGNIGSLVLELNGVDIYTLDLTSNSTGAGNPGSGSGNHVNASGDYAGSGFINVSTAKAGTFDNGTSFDNFKHRTGQWKVSAASQRNGWNYVRIKHVKGEITTNTNYVEWVNDSDSNDLSAGSNSLVFTGVGSLQISGVTYNTSGTGRYRVTVSNAYRYVYDTTATSFTTSNSGLTSSVTYNISSIAKASIGGGENHLKQIAVDETDNITASYILGGSVTAGVNVSHPIKDNLSNEAQSTASGILIYNVSDSATVTSETFQRESYRLQSGSYSVQADVAGGSLNWDSSQSLVGGSSTHNNGLQVYRERLYSPKNTLNSGDFRNSSDGGSLANGPSGNPNYSGATGLRTYYRKFQNAGSAKRDLKYVISGSATLVGKTDSIGSNNNFRLFFKMPSDGAGNTTGWLDAKTAFSYNTVTDNAGCAIGTVDTSANMANNISFGTVEVGTNEWVVAKIEADNDWTGNLDSFSVTFGAVGAVNASPNLNDIDCNQTGVNAKLSFGSSLGKGTYENVSSGAGFSAVDANGDYNTTGDRRAIFNRGQVISGDINETTNASGNSYPANSFGSGKANVGKLLLFLNTTSTAEGDALHVTDLSTFGSGNDLTSGSGFINLSAATFGEDSNGLPDYTKVYRTGQYQIASGVTQRNGWNYARIIHAVDGSNHASDYVEWVNDDSNPTISFSSISIGNFSSSSTYKCSGVTYFISPTGRFDFTVSNLYKYVYSSSASAISFPTTTNCTITQIVANGDGVNNSTVNATSRSLPSLNTSVSDAYDDDLVVQAAFSFDQGTSIPGETAHTVTLIGRVNHPLKGDTNTSSTSSAEFLVANFSDNSTDVQENFNGEAKRLKAGTTSYTTQAHVSDGSNNWNSATSMNGSDAGHNTGLIIYDGKLRSPQKVGPSGNLGDFRDTSQGGTIAAPSGNPDYGTLTNTTREYIRWFKNTSGGSKTNFDLSINGTGTIVQNTDSLGSSNKIQVFAKIPHSSSDQSTGWMDTAKAFATGQNGDNAGALVGSLDSSLNAANEVTFGTKFVDNNEYILIKIVADKTWTGNITQMSVSWS